MMNDDKPVRLSFSGAPLVGQEPWPKEVVDLAFEIWAFKSQRNARVTADILNSIGDRFEDSDIESQIAWTALKERPLPHKTVANWVNSRKWEKKRIELMKSLAPGMHRLVEDELRILSLDAVKVQKELLLNPETPAVVKAKIIDSVLDRTGHQPFVRPSDDSKPRGPQVEYENTASGMSIEELRDILFGTGKLKDGDDDSLENETGQGQEENG